MTKYGRLWNEHFIYSPGVELPDKFEIVYVVDDEIIHTGKYSTNGRFDGTSLVPTDDMPYIRPGMYYVNMLTKLIEVKASRTSGCHITYMTDEGDVRVEVYNGVTEFPQGFFPENTRSIYFEECGSTLTSLAHAFENLPNLEFVDLHNVFDRCPITDLSYAFAGCSNLRGIYVGNKRSDVMVERFTHTFSGCCNLEDTSLYLLFPAVNPDVAFMFEGCLMKYLNLEGLYMASSTADMFAGAYVGTINAPFIYNNEGFDGTTYENLLFSPMLSDDFAPRAAPRGTYSKPISYDRLYAYDMFIMRKPVAMSGVSWGEFYDAVHDHLRCMNDEKNPHMVDVMNDPAVVELFRNEYGTYNAYNISYYPEYWWYNPTEGWFELHSRVTDSAEIDKASSLVSRAEHGVRSIYGYHPIDNWNMSWPRNAYKMCIYGTDQLSFYSSSGSIVLYNFPDTTYVTTISSVDLLRRLDVSHMKCLSGLLHATGFTYDDYKHLDTKSAEFLDDFVYTESTDLSGLKDMDTSNVNDYSYAIWLLGDNTVVDISSWELMTDADKDHLIDLLTGSIMELKIPQMEQVTYDDMALGTPTSIVSSSHNTWLSGSNVTFFNDTIYVGSMIGLPTNYYVEITDLLDEPVEIYMNRVMHAGNRRNLRPEKFTFYVHDWLPMYVIKDNIKKLDIYFAADSYFNITQPLLTNSVCSTNIQLFIGERTTVRVNDCFLFDMVLGGNVEVTLKTDASIEYNEELGLSQEHVKIIFT
jgi:hypothetical protein